MYASVVGQCCIHIVEELQKPFHLDVLHAPNDLSSDDDTRIDRHMGEQIVESEARVQHTCDLESNNRHVYGEAPSPRHLAWPIDGYEP